MTPARAAVKKIEWTNVIAGVALSIGPSLLTMLGGLGVLNAKMDLVYAQFATIHSDGIKQRDDINTYIRNVDARSAQRHDEVRDEFNHQLDQMHADLRDMKGKR